MKTTSVLVYVVCAAIVAALLFILAGLFVGGLAYLRAHQMFWHEGAFGRLALLLIGSGFILLGATIIVTALLDHPDL